MWCSNSKKAAKKERNTESKSDRQEMLNNVLKQLPSLNLGSKDHKVFLSFFLKDKTSAPDIFSSCSFIHRADI